MNSVCSGPLAVCVLFKDICFCVFCFASVIIFFMVIMSVITTLFIYVTDFSLNLTDWYDL